MIVSSRKNSLVERFCTQCYKPFFAKLCWVRKGKARFCSISCVSVYQKNVWRERSIRQTKSCLECGKSVQRYPSQFRGGDIYCSHMCHDKTRSRKGNVLRYCVQCKNEFYLMKSDMRKRPGKYCSNKYAAEALKKRELRKCGICGLLFKTLPCRIKDGGGKYCSWACERAAWKSRANNGNMIYTPGLLRMLKIDCDEYCNFPGCLNLRSKHLWKRTSWRVCKLHADRITNALLGQKRRRLMLLQAG